MHLFCESHELKNAIPEIRIHDLVYKSFQINFSPRHTTVINVIDNKEHVIIKILKIKKRPFWENNKKKKKLKRPEVKDYLQPIEYVYKIYSWPIWIKILFRCLESIAHFFKGG